MERKRNGRIHLGLIFLLWSPGFPKMAEHLLADEKQWTNSLFCFACTWSVCFTFKLSLWDSFFPWVLALLPFWFSPPSHLGGVGEWLGGPWLPAEVNSHQCASEPSTGPRRAGFDFPSGEIVIHTEFAWSFQRVLLCKTAQEENYYIKWPALQSPYLSTFLGRFTTIPSTLSLSPGSCKPYSGGFIILITVEANIICGVSCFGSYADCYLIAGSS